MNNKVFDLVNNKYNLLIAAGSNVDCKCYDFFGDPILWNLYFPITANKVGYHDVGRLASAEAKLLSDVSEIAAASKILLRLHGAFMLAAWLGTASVGILLARYFRQTWVGSQVCGKDLWFAVSKFID